MDSFDLLVVNGLVVTASDTANYDIAVKNGKIVLLAPPGVLSKDKASRVIDAEGGYVMVEKTFQLRKFRLTHISISQVA
jgi:dihydropyrimidinase